MIINQIQGGRWDTFLRRLLPIKDRSIAPILASELVGQVVVQEWEPEFYKLRDENLCFGMAQRAAVAAEFSHVKIRNPDLSGSMVILEQIWVRLSAAGIIDMATGGVELAGFTAAATAFRDLRSGVLTAGGVTVAELSSDTNVGALGGTSVARAALGTNEIVQLKFPVILPPATEFIIRAFTANVTMNVTILWRERGAEPSELAV